MKITRRGFVKVIIGATIGGVAQVGSDELSKQLEALKGQKSPPTLAITTTKQFLNRRAATIQRQKEKSSIDSALFDYRADQALRNAQEATRKAEKNVDQAVHRWEKSVQHDLNLVKQTNFFKVPSQSLRRASHNLDAASRKTDREIDKAVFNFAKSLLKKFL